MLPSYMPMAPTRVREPFHRDGWVYEEKVDGYRLLAYTDGARVVATSPVLTAFDVLYVKGRDVSQRLLGERADRTIRPKKGI